MKKFAVVSSFVTGLAGASAAASSILPAHASHLMYGGIDAQGVAQAVGAGMTVAGILTGNPAVALCGFMIFSLAQ